VVTGYPLQELTVSSSVTDGVARGRAAPGQAKCKNWAPLVDILIFSIL